METWSRFASTRSRFVKTISRSRKTISQRFRTIFHGRRHSLTDRPKSFVLGIPPLIPCLQYFVRGTRSIADCLQYFAPRIPILVPGTKSPADRLQGVAGWLRDLAEGLRGIAAGRGWTHQKHPRLIGGKICWHTIKILRRRGFPVFFSSWL